MLAHSNRWGLLCKLVSSHVRFFTDRSFSFVTLTSFSKTLLGKIIPDIGPESDLHSFSPYAINIHCILVGSNIIVFRYGGASQSTHVGKGTL